jgi:AraC-like DNA-binding protein
LPALLRANGLEEPDTVLADIAMRLLDIGMNMGLPKRKLLDVLGVSDNVVQNPVARLPLEAMLRLADAIEKQSGNAVAGLQMAAQLSPRNHSDIAYPILYAPNIATALQLFCETQPFYQNVLRANLSLDEGDQVRFSFDLQHAKAELAAPLVEWVMATHIALGHKVAGQARAVIEIGFAHAPRRAAPLYADHFGCPVHFQQRQSYVLYDKTAVYLEAKQHNIEMIRAAQTAHCQLEHWLDTGKTNLAFAYVFCLLQLDRRPVSLERMAAAFGQTERTMRRLLITEGMPFREIVDLVRRVLFKLYQIEGKFALGEIAPRLGYSDLSALSRARRRWKDA